MGIPGILAAWLVAATAISGMAQTKEDTFRVYSDHPRLLLNARRLRLLRRERERQSMRWQQFQLLMSGKVPMPEPGFAGALYYRVADDTVAGKRAIEWALGPGGDLRQLALVFDWCQDLLTPAQGDALAKKLRQGRDRGAQSSSVPAVRDRVFAAIALADRAPDDSAAALQHVVQDWWQKGLAPELRTGRKNLPLDDDYALFELLHVLRDNLNLELRDDAVAWFKDRPVEHLLCYYPAVWPAAENEYHIPYFDGKGDPDLRRAAIFRAAELSMVSYDTNAVENQSLQGWLMHDRYILRSPFAAPYEFLWANPYQPGLSYYHLPLVFHDARTGQLFVRSSWEDNASWLGFFDGHLQLFQDGRITELDPRLASGSLAVGPATILSGRNAQRFEVALKRDETAFVIGLAPRRLYDVEVDREEVVDQRSDAGGILALDLPQDTTVGVHIRQR